MKRITSLTREQSARFPEFVRKWTEIGLCTAPARRSEAERGVRIAYELAGLKPPEKIVWCGSPLSQGFTRAIVFGLAEGKIKIPKMGGGPTNPGASVRASVRDSVGASVRDSVRASVGASVRDSVGASVRDSVGASVGDSVWDSVWASVGDSVWASVRDSVGASVRDSVRASGYGQHDASWLGFYDYFAEACGLGEETQKLTGLWLIAKNAGWFLPHQKICWISERHSVLHRDDRGRLHAEHGPALAYPDGFAIWAWHGVRVSQQLIEAPETLKVSDIETERNAEIRRVKIERYGLARYLLDAGAVVLQRDDYGTLYRKEIAGDEPILMVKVLNSTAEPDGSFKDYFLRVPPQMNTAHEAVAWTFGKKEESYAPLVET